jgi:hypothetical protein
MKVSGLSMFLTFCCLIIVCTFIFGRSDDDRPTAPAREYGWSALRMGVNGPVACFTMEESDFSDG